MDPPTAALSGARPRAKVHLEARRRMRRGDDRRRAEAHLRSIRHACLLKPCRLRRRRRRRHPHLRRRLLHPGIFHPRLHLGLEPVRREAVGRGGLALQQLECKRLQQRVDLLRAEVVSPQQPPPCRATVRPLGTPRQDSHLLSGQQVARHQLVVDRVDELEQCKSLVGHGLGLGVAAQELHLFDREDLALLDLDFRLRVLRLVVAAARVLHEEGKQGGGPLEQHGL